MAELGAIYTRGQGFRARAEERQRHYRSQVLGAGAGTYGHLLDDAAADAGKNFVLPGAHQEVIERAKRKGVELKRTTGNMLSSQAMCFNVFTPLKRNLTLAASVLKPFFPLLREVTSIAFEHTPSNDVFGDQTGLGGVDCDLLVRGRGNDGEGCLIALETKFVEPEFSTCGFRRKEPGKRCPDDVHLGDDGSACLYTVKGYRYWQRTTEQRTVRLAFLPQSGCPFAGPEWQLWVNHALVHAEAAREGARHAFFAVCAPRANDPLLGAGVLERFRGRLERPESFVFVPLDELLGVIASEAKHTPELETWAAALQARYAGI